MSLDQTHPDLALEQGYIDGAYAEMDRMHREVESFGEHGRNDFEREAFDRWKAARLAMLTDRFSPLVFGRIDRDDDQTYYVGRQHVYGESHEDVLVIDWRAPVSRAFYRADSNDHMGLRRRRHYLIDGRAVLGIADDDLAVVERIIGNEVLQAELLRQRTGVMRDIVSTIQAEQDRIIRAPLEGIVVVQGGPGTGKTAIGLHRASFLLYEHREYLSRNRVLVVGPNPTFMRYIAQVLPSLGEVAVNQRTIDELAPVAFVGPRETREVERLKGDARMADVLARALWSKTRPIEGAVEIPVQGGRVTLAVATIEAEASRIRERAPAHKLGRAMLRDALLMATYRAYQRNVRVGSTAATFEDVSRQTRATPAFRKALDGLWPAVGAEALVRTVSRSATGLARCADGIFSLDEQRTIVRGSARDRLSPADRILLDEAHALIEGAPERYGHIVVDEAQDLSPMQLRMLARRGRDGSMTVLGDLGQSTSAWAHDDWTEVLEHLPSPDGTRVDELTLGYRVAPAIMEVASAILAEAAPALRAPEAVRAEHGEVVVIASSEAERASRVASAAATLAEAEGVAAIVVPDVLFDAIEHGVADAGVSMTVAERDGLGAPLTLVRAGAAKGLEFDAVLVVEPASIVEEGGLRLLYIAVTRAMRSLTIVHAQPLPSCMNASVTSARA